MFRAKLPETGPSLPPPSPTPRLLPMVFGIIVLFKVDWYSLIIGLSLLRIYSGLFIFPQKISARLTTKVACAWITHMTYYLTTVSDGTMVLDPGRIGDLIVHVRSVLRVAIPTLKKVRVWAVIIWIQPVGLKNPRPSWPLTYCQFATSGPEGVGCCWFWQFRSWFLANLNVAPK